MTVYFSKARKKWRFDFVLAGQRYLSHPTLGSDFDTHGEAKAAEDEMRYRARQAPAARRTPTDITVLEAFEVFARSVRGTANFGNVQDHISDMLGRPEFRPDKPLREVTEQDVRDYIAWSRKQVLQVWIGGPDRKRVEGRPHNRLYKPHPEGKTRSNSTINHYLATLRAALNMAHQTYDPATNLPLLVRLPRIQELSTPRRLPRPISDVDITRIIREGCRVSARSKKVYRKHLVHAVLLCRMMGFRKSEVFNLERSRVDFELNGYWLPAEETKGNRDELVPGSPQVMRLLAYLCRRAEQEGQERLILYRDHRAGAYLPVADARSAWRSLRKQLGIEHHVFHHTKASYVTAIGRGASPATTQSLARHKDYKTTQRYLLVIAEDARAAADSAAFQGRSPAKESRQIRKGGAQPKLRAVK